MDGCSTRTCVPTGTLGGVDWSWPVAKGSPKDVRQAREMTNLFAIVAVEVRHGWCAPRLQVRRSFARGHPALCGGRHHDASAGHRSEHRRVHCPERRGPLSRTPDWSGLYSTTVRSPDGTRAAIVRVDIGSASEKRELVYVTAVVSSSPTLTVGGGPWRVSNGAGQMPRWRADVARYSSRARAR